MKTCLMLEVEYDPSATCPEGLASAMDRLLETACSIPGVWDDYGNPKLGEFVPVVLPSAAPAFVINVSGGLVQEVFCSHPNASVVLVDWDTEDCDPTAEMIVRVEKAERQPCYAYVAEYPVTPMAELADTETAWALEAAGVEFAEAIPVESELVEMCRRVAETAENWADCSDMREALAVFKELGRDCRELLDRHPQFRDPPRYVLYDGDTDEMASTTIYDSYREAVDDASAVNDVIVVPFVHPKP